MAQYRILSLDGGGIRGLVSAILVQALDSQFSILKQIDLFAGTSTGGIIALGLAAGVPIANIIDLYQKGGRNFQIASLHQMPASCETVRRRVGPQSHRVVSGDVHQRRIAKGASIYLGLDHRRSVKIQGARNHSATPLHRGPSCLAASDDHESEIFEKPSVDNATTLVDASLCTSAAPLYFPPFKHPVYGYCADGGVVANNPAVVAVANAIASGVSLQDIVLLSIGTGFAPSSMDVIGNPDCYGINQWAWPESSGSQPAFAIISALFDGSSDSTISNAACCSGTPTFAPTRRSPPTSASTITRPSER